MFLFDKIINPDKKESWEYQPDCPKCSRMRARIEDLRRRPKEFEPMYRYINDPHFHAMVNMILRQMEEFLFSPGEMREIVTLAIVEYEHRHFRPIFEDGKFSFPRKTKETK